MRAPNLFLTPNWKKDSIAILEPLQSDSIQSFGKFSYSKIKPYKLISHSNRKGRASWETLDPQFAVKHMQ